MHPDIITAATNRYRHARIHTAAAATAKSVGKPVGTVGNDRAARLRIWALSMAVLSGRRDSNSRPSPWQRLWFPSVWSV